MHLYPAAKINLHLRVGPLSSDGFHPLLSWFATVGLFDNLTISPAQGNDLVFACSDPRIPSDRRNLVVRAAELLRSTGAQPGIGPGGELADSSRRTSASDSSGCVESGASGPPPVSGPSKVAAPLVANVLAGVRLELTKRIPSGGGLGGGSSDAAAALIGLNRFWNLGFSTGQLADLGGRLGSDVPFFFFGPSSVCTGRGQIVQPIGRPRAKWAVLIFPDLAMPTPAVYRKFDEMKLGDRSFVSGPPDWDAWTRLPAMELLPKLVNDLEPPAFALSISLARLRDEVERSARRIIRMSGSGSTLFTLCDDKAEAHALALEIGERHGIKTMAVTLAPADEPTGVPIAAPTGC
jgi:4-diphosphocytidyl-2-C-methyl-D-erythritol kinase